MKKYLLDLAERALMTFLQAFGAVVVLTDVTTWRSAAAAGAAAVLSLVKGVIAGFIGERRTAALLPKP